ncbi:MAG: extracellular solute-binding protein [Chloroflexi bacterium]|nr:extracellular solute-binding protein [Chloroflexota bacterium]
MSTMLKIATSFLLLLAMVACARGPTPAGQVTTTPAAARPESGARPAWELDWERTLVAARNEGRVTMYTTQGAEFRTALGEAMARKFSVTLDSLTGRSEEIAERINREQKIQAYNADVLIAISTTNFGAYHDSGVLQSLEKVVVLPEVLGPKAWWWGEVKWLDLDPGEKTVFAFRDAVSPPMLVNTNLVKPGELKSWNDLLDPKWKGKILLSDPTTGGAGGQTMSTLAFGIKDWDFVRAFLKQEPTIVRDDRLVTEWVAQGKFPILIGPMKGVVYQFQQAGAPIDYFTPSEGTYSSVGAGTVALVKGSPHPNAAKVFINFLLSREGQTIAAETSGYQSARVDVPTDRLDPVTLRQPGIKYFATIDRGYRQKESEVRREVVRLFQEYMKK